VDLPDAQQQVLDGVLNLTAVTWCRFAASLAAFAALVWLDFTLLFFGGIFRSPREALGHLVSPEWPHTQSQHTSG
jgi:hypothetical protein